MDYISRPKKIRQDIAKECFSKIKDSLMVTILILGLLESYNIFLETLWITNKL